MILDEYYDNYDEEFPDLIIQILEYFNINNITSKPAEKSIAHFCNQYTIPDKNNFGLGTVVHNPEIIDRICRRLCDKNILTQTVNQGGIGVNNNYIYCPINKDVLKQDKKMLRHILNCKVYGFEYIYKAYKDLVVPIVWEKENGEYSAGTAFKYQGGIVTAKHCILDPTNVSIKGYTAEELRNSSICISDNEGLDLAFIDVQRHERDEHFFVSSEGQVMQEVLVMGYPKIPAFTDFLTTEKAVISSKAVSRMTPTLGAIAAYGYEYLAKIDAMLITAKIRGGNSGGPVIDDDGSLVGIACQMPNYDENTGNYDDLGYGIAVPAYKLDELIATKPVKHEVKDDFFRDFE